MTSVDNDVDGTAILHSANDQEEFMALVPKAGDHRLKIKAVVNRCAFRLQNECTVYNYYI